MLNIPAAPQRSSHVMEKRSQESIDMEKKQNKRLWELGIDPYQYDVEKDIQKKNKI